MRELIVRENLDEKDLKVIFAGVQKQGASQTPLESLDLSKAILDKQPLSLEDLLPYAESLPKTLKQVSIGNTITACNITKENQDRFWQILSHMPHLQALILKNNKIGDIGLVTLIPSINTMTRIEILDLSSNAITDVGFASLTQTFERTPNIDTVGLYENNIGDEGINALVKVLHLVPHLKTLDLGKNNISGKGLKSLVDALKKDNPSFQNLNITDNPISVNAREEIKQSLGKRYMTIEF